MLPSSSADSSAAIRVVFATETASRRPIIRSTRML